MASKEVSGLQAGEKKPPEPAAQEPARVPKCDLPETLATALFDLIPHQKEIPTFEIVDLGSGNGTLLAHALNRRAKKVVGYEIDPEQAAQSMKTLEEQYPERKGSFEVKNENFWDADISTADVVIIWGHSQVMAGMENKMLQQMKTNALVLTIDGQFPLRIRAIAEVQTTYQNKTFACPDAAAETADNTFLAAFQIPSTTAPFRVEPRTPYLPVRHVDLTATETTVGSTYVFFRRMICSEHKRFGCLEVVAPTNNNVLDHVLVNMETFKDIQGHTLKVNWKDSTNPANQHSKLIETKLGVEYLQKSSANIFYYKVPVSTPMQIQPGVDILLEFKLQNAFQPNLHLSFAFNIAGTQWFRDGLYDLVPSPRSLGVHFAATFERSNMGLWVKRHQRMPKCHFELIRNGHRIHSNLIEPSEMAAAVVGEEAARTQDVAIHAAGYANIYKQLTRTADENLWIRATFIEPARPFVYGFRVRGWNTTVKEAFRAHHKKNGGGSNGEGTSTTAIADVPVDTQEIVTVEGINSVVADFHEYKSLQRPGMTLRIFSKGHASHKLGISLLYDPAALVHKEGSTILIVLYLQGHDDFTAAWECIPATTATGATGVQEMCVFNHALPEEMSEDAIEFDVWFDVDVEASKAKSKLSPAQLEARNGHSSALERWMIRSGGNVSLIDTKRAVAPTSQALYVNKDVSKNTEIFTIPSHSALKPKCVLCKHDWYQELLDSVQHTKPVVHYALEYAKLALYTLHPKDVPFNTDEFSSLITLTDRIRDLKNYHQQVLPMQAAAKQGEDKMPDMKELLDKGMAYDQVAIEMLAYEQRDIIVKLYKKIVGYKTLPHTHDPEKETDHGLWLKTLFPDEQQFVDYVALTAKAVFPEFNVLPFVPLLKQDLNPNAGFFGNHLSIFVRALRDMKKDEAITVGCNSYHHYMLLFKGKDEATRLSAENQPGRCVDSVILAQSGVVIWKDKTSIQALEAYYSGSEDQSKAALHHALHFTKDAKQRELIQWALEQIGTYRH